MLPCSAIVSQKGHLLPCGLASASKAASFDDPIARGMRLPADKRKRDVVLGREDEVPASTHTGAVVRMSRAVSVNAVEDGSIAAVTPTSKSSPRLTRSLTNRNPQSLHATSLSAISERPYPSRIAYGAIRC